MKITDTLDQLLRALLSASEDEARDSSSTPGATGAERTAAGSPIRSGVPAGNVTDDAKPGGDEGATGASGGLGPRFTTADADASAPGDHVLPEWVRRSQERAVAPVEPETATLEAISMATDDAPPAEEPGHVEAGATVVSEADRIETVTHAVEEPAPVEAELFAVPEPDPVGPELSAVSEIAPVEAELFVAPAPEPDSEPPEVSETPVEPELSTVPEAPVEPELSAVAEATPAEAEPPVAEQAGPVEAELSAVMEAPVETEPVALEEPGPVETDSSVSDERAGAEAEESTAVERPVAAWAFSAPTDLEALGDEEAGRVDGADGLEPASASVEVEPAAPEADESTAPEPDESEDVAAVVPLTGADLARLETASRLAESLNLGFHLGLAVERIAAAATQGSSGVPALREATWLIERYVALLEQRPIGADIHMSAARLARTGDAIAGMKAIAAALDAASASAASGPPAGEAPDEDADRAVEELEAEPATDWSAPADSS